MIQTTARFVWQRALYILRAHDSLLLSSVAVGTIAFLAGCRPMDDQSIRRVSSDRPAQSAHTVAPAPVNVNADSAAPVPKVSDRDTVLADRVAYVVTDLGSLGGDLSSARAINDAGVVVGRAEISPVGPVRAFEYVEGRMRAVGPDESAGLGEAIDINDLGQIIGQSCDRNSRCQAWLWENGHVELLHKDGAAVSVLHMNNLGQIACRVDRKVTKDGYSVTLSTASLWDQGQWRTIGSDLKDPSVVASAVNDPGQVAGYSTCGCIPARGPQAFVWQDGYSIELGNFGGTTIALDINASGQIVGEADVLATSNGGVATRRHAFLWDQGNMIDLGTCNGTESGAAAINDAGIVVGWFKRGDADHAFIWRDGRMSDLNTMIPPDSGWTLTRANDINNQGQIVGEGLLDNRVRAFLLTPIR